MEQAERVNIVIDKDTRVERAYEKYGWLILAVSAIFGIGAAAVIAAPSYYVLTDPLYRDFYPVIIAWGAVLVGFNIFALVLTLIPFRGGERWAWYTLWMMPLLWLSLFALAPDLPLYLAFAVIPAAGLLLPYRRFFSGSA
jgi:cell division protein FtsW (lipid II flippase)